MSFKIEKESRNDINFIKLINTRTDEFIEIIPDLGGTINKIFFLLNSGEKKYSDK